MPADTQHYALFSGLNLLTLFSCCFPYSSGKCTILTNQTHFGNYGVIKSKHRSNRVGKQQTRGLFSAASDTHPPTWSLIVSLLIFQPLLVSEFCSTVQSETRYGPKHLTPPKRQWDESKTTLFCAPDAQVWYP